MAGFCSAKARSCAKRKATRVVATRLRPRHGVPSLQWTMCLRETRPVAAMNQPNKRRQQALDNDSYDECMAVLWDQRPKDVPILRCPVCRDVENQGSLSPVYEYGRRQQRRIVVASTGRYVCRRCRNRYSITVVAADQRDWRASMPWSPPKLCFKSGEPCPLSGRYSSYCIACRNMANEVIAKSQHLPNCP